MSTKIPELPFAKVYDVRGSSFEDINCEIHLLDYTENIKSIKPSELNYSVGELGYLPFKNEPSQFIQRIPQKASYKQGLVSSSIVIKRYNEKTGIMSEGASDTFLAKNKKAIGEMLLSKYSTFNKALQFAEENEKGSFSFCKYFAVSSDYRLLFKEEAVGSILANDTIKLYNSHNFLEELLSQYVGNEKLSK